MHPGSSCYTTGLTPLLRSSCSPMIQRASKLCMPPYRNRQTFCCATSGQHADAERLHSNFTAAWATWGWLPEVFGADLSAVHPEDPGYNLRPEHIESTWYLKALTGDPTGQYTRLAASIMHVLNHSRTECGYAPIKNVNTGAGCSAGLLMRVPHFVLHAAACNSHGRPSSCMSNNVIKRGLFVCCYCATCVANR